jgi:glycosyltransferase involved in cell wall biosynthesis
VKDLEGDDVTSADDGCHQARVLISTRDRAEDVARCVASILANDHVGFDVLVVDQSQDESTVSALRDHATDSRLQIVRSATVGLGRSRNVSLLMDGPDLCLVLDDDCIAPAGWVADMVGVMEANPEAGMVFGRVVAAEHDPALGFVPETGYERDEIVRSPRDFRPVGLGAAVGLRRSRVLDIGGFDPMLGPGAR